MNAFVPRYAIYFVPASETSLYRFGAGALGHDCYTGLWVPYHDFVPDNWPELTREPRIYGFHATLKAPFRLVSDYSEGNVVHELHQIAKRTRSVPILDLEVRSIGDFVALAPREPSDALDLLAEQCVVYCDKFRTPPTSAELQRRRKVTLTKRQDNFLNRWGYPYVFDEFKFHMTLTGLIDGAHRHRIVSILQHNFEAVCGNRRHAIDRLVLLRQDEADREFRVIAQVAIGALQTVQIVGPQYRRDR